MADGGRFERLIREKAQAAGRQYARYRQVYQIARDQRYAGDLPTDENGRVRLVCRRYAERRAVRVDEAGRPACFDAGHLDCEGCREDVLTERVETW